MHYNSSVCDNSTKYPVGGNYYDGKFIKFPDSIDRRQKKRVPQNLKSNTKPRKFGSGPRYTDPEWRFEDAIMEIPTMRRRLRLVVPPPLNSCSTMELTSVDSDEMSNGSVVWYNCADKKMQKVTRTSIIAEAFAAYNRKMEEQASEETLTAEREATRANVTSFEDDDDGKNVNNDVSEDVGDNVGDNSSVDVADDIEDDSGGNTPCAKTSFESCNETKEEESKFLKCGELLLDIHEQNFLVNCALCNASTNNWDEFLEHYKTAHPEFLYPNKEEEEPEPEINIQEDDKSAVESAYSELFDKIERQAEQKYNQQKAVAAAAAVEKKNSDNRLDITNKPLIEHLIFFFKHSPVLWDKSHPMHTSVTQRKNAITYILKNLTPVFPHLHLTYKRLSDLLVRLRIAYRCDLRHKYSAVNALNGGGDYKPKHWFFDHLSFLGNDFDSDGKVPFSNVEENIDNFKQIAAQPPIKFNDDYQEHGVLKFLESYEHLPCLWNINHANYSGKLEDKKKLSELFCWTVRKCPDMGIKTQRQLESLLRACNTWYSAEEYIRLYAKKFKLPYSSAYPRLYLALEFLHGHVPPFSCNICRNIFVKESDYRRHITANKGCTGRTKGYVHTSNHFDKRFPKVTNLERHARCHINEQPFSCRLCGKKFRNYITWLRHGHIHSKDKPYKCFNCDRCYYTLSMLRLHQRSHLNVLDKVCNVCGKLYSYSHFFYRSRDLSKPTCAMCERRFKAYSMALPQRKRCGVTKTAGQKKRKTVVPPKPPINKIKKNLAAANPDYVYSQQPYGKKLCKGGKARR